MKKILVTGILFIISGVIACKKDDPVNLNNPNLISPFTCSPGNVITPQGVFPQGSCPAGQGQNTQGQCIAGTPCQGGSYGTGTISSYYNNLNIIRRDIMEGFMEEVYLMCQRDWAWGSAACDHYSNNLELVIESMSPVGGTLTGGSVNNYVTVYVGVERRPLVSQAAWWPTNNNAGFRLQSLTSSFRVEVTNGQLGQDSLMVKLYYKNTEFSNGYISRFR